MSNLELDKLQEMGNLLARETFYQLDFLVQSTLLYALGVPFQGEPISEEEYAQACMKLSELQKFVKNSRD